MKTLFKEPIGNDTKRRINLEKWEQEFIHSYYIASVDNNNDLDGPFHLIAKLNEGHLIMNDDYKSSYMIWRMDLSNWEVLLLDEEEVIRLFSIKRPAIKMLKNLNLVWKP